MTRSPPASHDRAPPRQTEVVRVLRNQEVYWTVMVALSHDPDTWDEVGRFHFKYEAEEMRQKIKKARMGEAS